MPIYFTGSSFNGNLAANLIFTPDNTYDIGAIGATRPKNAYIAGSLTTAGLSVTGNGQIAFAGSYVTASGGFYAGVTRAGFTSPSDGVMVISNYALSDFGRLQFGGTTSSFPALKRSTTNIQVRLADDSAYAPIDALSYKVGGVAGADFGPGVVTSITVVKGIVTAIS